LAGYWHQTRWSGIFRRSINHHINLDFDPMTQQNPAIVGVHSATEAEIRSRYPSLAGTGLGRIIGNLCNSIPTKIWGIKISHALFALPVAPAAAGLYMLQKVFGEKYVLTNRSIQRCKSFGSDQLQTVDLKEIEDIDVIQEEGQEFYHASNLHILDSSGQPVMRLNGVPNAEIFRESILKARDSRNETAEALATIDARQTA
jgi:hypothetical protein